MTTTMAEDGNVDNSDEMKMEKHSHGNMFITSFYDILLSEAFCTKSNWMKLSALAKLRSSNISFIYCKYPIRMLILF